MFTTLLFIACGAPLVCGPGTVERDGACVVSPADADADTDTDADTDSDTDADSDADADTDADADADADADSDTDADTSDTGGWSCTFQSELGADTSISGNTCAATPLDHSPIVSAISCAPTERMVVLQWVAPSAGIWHFSTEGSAFDTVLEVVAPCSTVLGCADDRGLLPTPQVSDLEISLAAGEVVHVKIGGYAGVCGDYTLTITPPGGTPPGVSGAVPPAVPTGVWAGTANWTTGGTTEQAVVSATVLATSPTFLGTGTTSSGTGTFTLTGEVSAGGLKGESSATGPFTCEHDGTALQCGFYRWGFPEPTEGTFTLQQVP